MAHYSIKDLEKMSGILAHTIRIWELRYKIIEPQRTDTNIRVYSDNDLKKILNVSLLNRNGIKISKISKLTPDQIQEKIIAISQSDENFDGQIDALTIAMIEMNETKIEELINEQISNLGFEETIIKVIYPFLHKIGTLWQTNMINPAQEHFLSNIIRRKLFSAIEKIPTTLGNDKQKFLIYLPEGEYHEIGLLFYVYLIKKHGFHPVYLGQSVPFSDIIEVQQKLNVDYVLTTFITTLQDFSFTEYALNLSKSIKKSKIILTGGIAANLDLKKISNILTIKGLPEFKNFLLKIKQ